MSYTKLFSSIVTSSIWTEDAFTCKIWVTLLAIADKNGEVHASIPGLAQIAGVTIPQVEAAITKFLSPDRYSRTPDDQGRRIEKIDGGWMLLNHAKYRLMGSKEEEKTAHAKRQAAYRDRKERNNHVTQSDGNVTESDARVTPSDAPVTVPTAKVPDSLPDKPRDASVTKSDASVTRCDVFVTPGDGSVTEDRDIADTYTDTDNINPPNKSLLHFCEMAKTEEEIAELWGETKQDHPSNPPTSNPPTSEPEPPADPPKEPKAKREKFTPPTLAEWLAHGATLNPPYAGPDAEAAFYSYDAKGWLVGKAPMKNWRSALMTCYMRRTPVHAPVPVNGHNHAVDPPVQSEADFPDFGETPDGKLVNEIIAAYQDGTKPWPKLMETRRILLPQVKRGLGPEILEKTKSIAAFLKKWPSDERKFWPSAHSFFAEARWNDPPESYKKVKNLNPW